MGKFFTTRAKKDYTSFDMPPKKTQDAATRSTTTTRKRTAGRRNAAAAATDGPTTSKRTRKQTREPAQVEAAVGEPQVPEDYNHHLQVTNGESTTSVTSSENEHAGMRGEWRNSVRMTQRPRVLSVVDPTARLADVLERTFNSFRERSNNENNSRLVNRLTTAKELPTFSGDPFEWLHFKEEYELSSRLGEYGERENVSRLFKALKGDAREAVHTLLATSCDATSIIRTLDLRYGNKRSLAERVVSNLRKLPAVDSGAQSLTHFATELRNATVAFKSLNLTGYLYSPDLIRVVGNKLPEVLKFAYRRYVANVAEDKSDLEKLSDFLYSEAELSVHAGFFDDEPPMFNSGTPNAKKASKTVKTAVSCAATHSREGKKEPRACGICKRDNHPSAKCRILLNESVEKRWNLARKNKLCFNCLNTGHGKFRCTQAKCDACDKSHHSLLHIEGRYNQAKALQEPASGEASVSARVNASVSERDSI